MWINKWLLSHLIWHSIYNISRQKSSLVDYAAFLKIKSLINNVTSDSTNLVVFIEATNSVRRCYLEVFIEGINGTEIKKYK